MKRKMLIRAILFTIIVTPIFSYMLKTGFGTYAIKIRKFESSLIGLKRIVTLYDMNGDPIKQWEGRFKIVDREGICTFIHQGKVIKISGTYSIEEIDSPLLEDSTKTKIKNCFKTCWKYVIKTKNYIYESFTELNSICGEWYRKKLKSEE